MLPAQLGFRLPPPISMQRDRSQRRFPVLSLLLTSTLLNDWITSPITIEVSGLLGSFRSTHFNVEMGPSAGVVLELSFPK